MAVSVAVALLMLPVSGQEAKQKAFGSPEEAVKALVETVQAGDTKGMMAILGPEGEDIISSGDEVADKNTRERFVKDYQEKVDFVKEKEDRVSVILGNDHWPFPIPIVKMAEGWVFDTKAGREEVLNRRIGRNELNAIQVCRAYVEAQREYAGTDRERDGIIQYAQKILSDPYRRNGLYWEAAEGEIASPLGPVRCSGGRERVQKNGDKPRSLSRILLQDPQRPGKECPRGGIPIRDQRTHGGWVCTGGLACGVWGFRGNDVYREPDRHGLSEGLGSKDRAARESHDALQSGPDLEESPVGVRFCLGPKRLLKKSFLAGCSKMLRCKAPETLFTCRSGRQS